MVSITKPIKNKLGIGGSIKKNEIYFQGDKRDKIISILESQGHSVKRIGGQKLKEDDMLKSPLQ